MFLLTCPVCRQDHLVGPRSVRRLHNLRPGLIVVELSCPYGHRVLEVTGSARAAGGVARPHAGPHAAATVPCTV